MFFTSDSPRTFLSVSGECISEKCSPGNNGWHCSSLEKLSFLSRQVSPLSDAKHWLKSFSSKGKAHFKEPTENFRSLLCLARWRHSHGRRRILSGRTSFSSHRICCQYYNRVESAHSAFDICSGVSSPNTSPPTILINKDWFLFDYWLGWFWISNHCNLTSDWFVHLNFMMSHIVYLVIVSQGTWHQMFRKKYVILFALSFFFHSFIHKKRNDKITAQNDFTFVYGKDNIFVKYSWQLRILKMNSDISFGGYILILFCKFYFLSTWTNLIFSYLFFYLLQVDDYRSPQLTLHFIF